MRLIGSKNAMQNETNPMPKYTSCLFAKMSFASETKMYEMAMIGMIKNGWIKSKCVKIRRSSFIKKQTLIFGLDYITNKALILVKFNVLNLRLQGSLLSNLKLDYVKFEALWPLQRRVLSYLKH